MTNKLIIVEIFLVLVKQRGEVIKIPVKYFQGYKVLTLQEQP